MKTQTDEIEFQDDRRLSNVECPRIPIKPLSSTKLWLNDKTPNIDILVQHLKLEGRLLLEDAFMLIRKASALFKAEPNLLRLNKPITICGDIHGQFYDLIRLLEAGGNPKDTQYLFLGDYVDRGCFSCECVFYLYAIKICYPETFFLLRGNHECRHLTSFFNFKDECLFKYNIDIYDAFMDSFDNLPIAATVEDKFLCLHGGLSPNISSISEINAIDRFREIPREGAFCDLLWADPVSEDNDSSSESDDNDDINALLNKENSFMKREGIADEEMNMDYSKKKHQKRKMKKRKKKTVSSWFSFNKARQCSYIFGVDATKHFLHKNKLMAIIRAHEAQSLGYKMHMTSESKETGFPLVVTIFSAPNYCDAYGNKASCLKLDDDLFNIRQFVATSHPYYLPNFMDVFTWSLPFVAEKVTDMLADVINLTDEQELEDEINEQKDKQKELTSVLAKRGPILKEKVKAVSKMLQMYKMLRTENDLIVKLKQLTPNSKLPLGVLSKGREGIEKAISSFDEARKADAENERMPTDEEQKKRNSASVRRSSVDV